MATRLMVNSDDEERDRSRSRSPRARGGANEDESNSDSENLSPFSRKVEMIVERVVAKQVAPINKKLNKLVDASSQNKGSSDQIKRVVSDVKKATSQIEDHLKKSTKGDPKSSLSGFVITKMYASVYKNLKRGQKKDVLQASVWEELLDQSIVNSVDEMAVKSAAGTEMSHLKAHLRSLISQDLSVGNAGALPKSTTYIKNHLKVNTLEVDDLQYLTIMALGRAKFENMKPVPLGESDKDNKKFIEEDINNYWGWVHLKYDLYLETGVTQDGKLTTIMDRCGYQPKKGDGTVRRANV